MSEILDTSKRIIPEEKISMGIKELDPKGEENGTEYWCTTTFYFKITDKREDIAKKALQAFDIAQKNLKSS